MELATLRLAHALPDFVGPDCSIKFPVDRKPARCARYIDFPAAAGNLDVAFGVGNLDVTFPGFNIDVSARAANLDVANSIRHVDGSRHVRDADVALLVPDRQRSLLRNCHLEIEADPRVACAAPGRWGLEPVPSLHDFNAHSLGSLLSIALIPGLGILFAG